MTPFTPPSPHARIRVVESFDELVTTSFEAGINALCWKRSLPGDFNEVVEKLVLSERTTTLEDSRLTGLPLSAAGRTAVDILVEDQRLLRAHGRSPVLDCIKSYPRDADSEVMRTDVYSYHVDSAPVEADTWLCTYHGPTSEGLRNEEAQRRVDVPETRAELLKDFGGKNDHAFLEHLKVNCYDLHYVPIGRAQPYSFGLGNMWRIAVDHPGSLVPPCIHRAPDTLAGHPPRLLLIS